MRVQWAIPIIASILVLGAIGYGVVFGQESLWQTLPTMPLSRSDFTGNAVGTKVYLMQGNGAGMNLIVYDTISENYAELAPVPYLASHSASAVHDGKIYVAGGCAIGNSCPTAVVYDIASNTWADLPDMPLPNLSPTAKIVGNDFFVIGGSPNANACQKYNIPTNVWSLCADMLTGRNHLSSAVYDNKIYVINGRQLGGPDDLTANEVYDPISNSWQILADKPTGMSGGWGGIFNNKIFVIGGESPLTGANEWYDPVTDLWTIGPDMPTPRHGLVCEPVGSKIYCFGGGTIQSAGISAIVEVFDADSFLSSFCVPPGTEDWLLTQSCNLSNSITITVNVIIANGAVLTIPNGVTLTITSGNSITVLSGSGMLIKFGGTVIVVF